MECNQSFCTRLSFLFYLLIYEVIHAIASSFLLVHSDKSSTFFPSIHSSLLFIHCMLEYSRMLFFSKPDI
jgi:hypothetical protein